MYFIVLPSHDIPVYANRGRKFNVLVHVKQILNVNNHYQKRDYWNIQAYIKEERQIYEHLCSNSK